jgi:hypothetical protein
MGIERRLGERVLDRLLGRRTLRPAASAALDLTAIHEDLGQIGCPAHPQI